MTNSGICWFLGIAVGGVMVMTANCVLAQITPDGTLPTNVQLNGSIFNITGGAQAGGNLFHSFREFSVPTRGEAFFNNAVDIQNIISRVTGGSISNIDGLIRANGTANFFLINPGGIVFGQNASLNVGGSFVASTASSLKFASGFEFSATPQTTPLLTVSVPIGLQFGLNAGDIRVQGISGFRSSLLGLGLRVLPGKTLALVGGNVILEGTFLNAPGGQIELGSVAGVGQVNLNPTLQGWDLNYQNIQNFGNIQISRSFVDISIEEDTGIQVLSDNSAIKIQALQLDISGTSVVRADTFTSMPGPDVKIDVQKLIVREGASVSARTFSAGEAGDLTVNATESVNVTGTSSGGMFPSALTTITSSEGKAGSLTINTRELLVSNGAQIQTTSSGSGEGGNLTINATESVQLNGGVLSASSQGQGKAGSLTINTPVLLAQNRAQAQTVSFGSGDGGSLTINATNKVQLTNSGLSASSQGQGKAGSLTINTPVLLLGDGAQVLTAAFDAGEGGSLTVNATESVQLIGESKDGRNSSGLFAATQGSGKAGDVTVKTKDLFIANGADISVSSTRGGEAGNLSVTTNQVRLDNGRITAQTSSGNGGNITMNIADFLLLRRNSNISTTAGIDGQPGDGGNITINTPNGFIIAVPNENSDITANAFSGSGGRVTINATDIFGIAPLSREELERLRPVDLDPTQLPTNDITAISQQNPTLSGQITINTPDVDPNRGLVELPTTLVDASNQIAQSCTAFANGQGSEFIVTGRGGLPPSPDEPLTNDIIWTDTRIPTITASQPETAVKPSPKNHAVAVIPATGWVFNGKGEVTLISASNTATLGNTNAACATR